MAAFDTIRFIESTKRGEPLTTEQIRGFVSGYMAGEVSEAQAAAWLMAVCLEGLPEDAVAALTVAMAEHGEAPDLSGLPHTADKHSTGGVGDKVTLVACPLAVAAGSTVAKMSGRGLGHTGGTVDKLEAIPGLRTALSAKEFRQQAARVGLVIASQSQDLSPADQRLYALRHETATVDSIALIAASVMCKKLVAGASAIVLDVKWGRGAFMRTLKEAEQLADLMCRIGVSQARAMGAAVTPMNQPLGHAVGHTLEVREAIDALRCEGPADLTELAIQIAARMVFLSGATETLDASRRKVEESLRSGSALEKLAEMVKAQGGDRRVIDNPARLPKAPCIDVLRSPSTGVVRAVDALRVAEVVAALGGASRGSGPIDHTVGVRLVRKCGEPVEPGDALAEVHAATPAALEEAKVRMGRALRVGDPPSDEGTAFEIRWVY